MTSDPIHDPIPGASEHADLVRKRQRTRATVLAIILGAFVVLVFAISIAKIQAGQRPAGSAQQEMQH